MNTPVPQKPDVSKSSGAPKGPSPHEKVQKDREALKAFLRSAEESEGDQLTAAIRGAYQEALGGRTNGERPGVEAMVDQLKGKTVRHLVEQFQGAHSAASRARAAQPTRAPIAPAPAPEPTEEGQRAFAEIHDILGDGFGPQAKPEAVIRAINAQGHSWKTDAATIEWVKKAQRVCSKLSSSGLTRGSTPPPPVAKVIGHVDLPKKPERFRGPSPKKLQEKQGEAWRHVFGAYKALQGETTKGKARFQEGQEGHFRESLQRWIGAFEAWDEVRRVISDSTEPQLLQDARLAYADAQRELAQAAQRTDSTLQTLMGSMENVAETRERMNRVNNQVYAAVSVAAKAAPLVQKEAPDRKTHRHGPEEGPRLKRRKRRGIGGEWEGRHAYGRKGAVERKPSEKEREDMRLAEERRAILELRDYEALKALRRQADKLEKELEGFKAITRPVASFLEKAGPLLKNPEVTDLFDVQREIHGAVTQLSNLKKDSEEYKRVQALSALKDEVDSLIRSVTQNPTVHDYNATAKALQAVYEAIRHRSYLLDRNYRERLERLARRALHRLSVEHEGRRYPLKDLRASQRKAGPALYSLAEGKGPHGKTLKIVDQECLPEGGPPQGVSLKQVEQFALGGPRVLEAWLSEARRLANLSKAEALKGITIDGLPVTHLRFFRSHPRGAHRVPPETGVSEVPPSGEERLQLVAYTNSALSGASRHRGAERLPHEQGHTALQSFNPGDELPKGLEDALTYAKDADKFLEAWEQALRDKKEKGSLS